MCRRSATIAMGLLLTVSACVGDGTEDSEDVAIEPQPAPAAVGAIAAGLRWSDQAGGAASSLTLFDADGAAMMRIACEEPARMVLDVETFRAVGSEERLSFGVDGEPFVFVADPTADRPSGVQAEAPITDDLLDRFDSAREVSAVYGAQSFGPYMPPDPEMTQRFVARCRQLQNG